MLLLQVGHLIPVSTWLERSCGSKRFAVLDFQWMPCLPWLWLNLSKAVTLMFLFLIWAWLCAWEPVQTAWVKIFREVHRKCLLLAVVRHLCLAMNTRVQHLLQISLSSSNNSWQINSMMTQSSRCSFNPFLSFLFLQKQSFTKLASLKN